MNRTALLVAGLVVGAAALAATYRSAASHETDPSPLKGNYTYSEAGAFRDYPVYATGRQLGELPLTAVDRKLEPVRLEHPSVREDYVSFTYGDCDATGGACAPPLQIQTWPACERHPSLYQEDAIANTYLRGVPARWFDENARLELSVATVTVVLFGEGQSQLLEVANALGILNPTVFPDQAAAERRGLLPPPPTERHLKDAGCDRANSTPDGGPQDVAMP